MPLTATLANDPAIRALSLRPYRIGEGRYQIVGRLGTYDLTITRDGATCTCIAASSGQRCAHSIAAVRQYITDRRASMKIQAERVGTSESHDYKQPVRIKQRGIYGGVFKRYSLPKKYPKFQSQDLEEKFFVTFLLTHDAGARPLPKITEAFCGVRTKRFYDPTKDLATTMVRLYAALLNGKMTLEQIASCDDEELPDLDDLIGYPAMLFIKPSPKPDKNGIYANQIDTQAGGFQPPDNAMRKAAKAIWDRADMKYAENGLRYLASPECTYEDAADSDGPIPDNGNGGGSFDDDLDDELPF